MIDHSTMYNIEHGSLIDSLAILELPIVTTVKHDV